MAMNDDRMVKIMETLGLDYGPAERATKAFEEKIASLNKQILEMKSNALKGPSNASNAFSSQLGQVAQSNKVILDQYGNTLSEIGKKADDSSKKQAKFNKELADLIHLRKTQQIDAQTFVQEASSFRTDPSVWNSLKKNEQVSLVRELSQAEKEHYSVLNQKYKLEQSSTKEIKKSAIAAMEAQAVSIQQKASANGLSNSYIQQASLIRSQLATLQQKLSLEGKLSSEEVKQTNQLKEQLTLLKSQQKTELLEKNGSPNIVGNEFARRSSWFLTGTAFYGSINAAKEAVQTITEVESGVTEIARVMEDSTFVFKDYRNQLLQLGVDYGQTFDVVQDIALRWAQAGYNVRDSLENTKTSLLALNTAELDASNATESLIGIMSQWQLTSKDLPLVLDKINKTADDFTVTSQDLVDGLLRSSGAAKVMGLSLDQTISLLTVLREASGRTGREVGNALNSILSYIQRPKSIDVFEALGIRMFTDNTKTQFRPAMEIFTELSQKWGTASAEIKDGFVQAAQEAGLFSEDLAIATGAQEEFTAMTQKAAEAQENFTDIEKRDAAQAAAGVYRRNYLIALLERFSQTQSVLNNITDAAGYSQTENARTMETLEKKFTSLKTAAQELAVALGDAGLIDLLKDLTDGAKNITDSFAKLDDETKAFIITALELLAALKAIKTVAGLFTAKNLVFGAESVLAALGPWGQLAAAIAAVGSAILLFQNNYSKATAQSVQDSLTLIDAKKKDIESSDKLIQKYNELNDKTGQSNNVKGEMLSIQQQLADIYPDYIDGLDAEGNKIITNIPLLREMNKLKQQELDLEREKVLLNAKSRIPQLDAEAKKIQDQIDANNKKLATGDTNELQGNLNPRIVDVSSQIRQQTINLIGELAKNKQEKDSINAILKNISDNEGIPLNTLTSNQYGANGKDNSADGSNADKLIILYKDGETLYVKESEVASYLKQGWSRTPPSGGSSKTKAYKNEPLQNALRDLQHKKQMDQMTVQEEITTLKKIKELHVQTADERMDIDERIYSAEKSLKDKTLQDSVNWINEKKSLDQLSAQEEIAAWNRVLINQVGNIEAVKQATKSLYSLQKQLREKAVDDEKSKLKNLQSDIKDAYDDRIDLVEKEAAAKKKAQQEIIKGIEAELKLLNRNEDQNDYEKKMADLREQLNYWSVRTGENARQQLADVRKQIAEAEHDREIELQKQTLEDKKQTAEDEIDTIEETAKQEKEKWQAAYKEMEKAFKDHNLDIVAQAATYSKQAYDEWYKNYVVPMQEALMTGNVSRFEESTSGIGKSIDNLPSHDWGMTDQDYQQMITNKNRWWELFNAGNSQTTNAEMLKLNEVNNQLRLKYGRDPAKGEYPKFHTGGISLTEGWAKVLPGELWFPQDLSKDLNTLMKISSGITGKVAAGNSGSVTTTTTDNRREIKIQNLLNIEKNYMEDAMDGEILSRELQREIAKL